MIKFLKKDKKEKVENLMELSERDAQKIVATGHYDDFQSNNINSGARIQGIKEIIEKIHLK